MKIKLGILFYGTETDKNRHGTGTFDRVGACQLRKKISIITWHLFLQRNNNRLENIKNLHNFIILQVSIWKIYILLSTSHQEYCSQELPFQLLVSETRDCSDPPRILCSVFNRKHVLGTDLAMILLILFPLTHTLFFTLS